MMIHTSDSLKAQDGFENYHYQLENGDKYQLTEGEIGWLDHIDGKYCIADHLRENMDENNVYTVDVTTMSEALTDDTCFPKAVMLSDDSALQAIFYYTANEVEELRTFVAYGYDVHFDYQHGQEIKARNMDEAKEIARDLGIIHELEIADLS